MAGDRGEVPNLTVAAILTRYADEVSTGKKGERWERIRLALIGRDRLSQVRLRALDAPHVADWQQRRLQAVSSASVRRERNLLNAAFEIARKEWRWLVKNPFEGVRRPKEGKARTRIATDDEIALLMSRANDSLLRVIGFALETGMRASEIASLSTVHGQVAILYDSKNGEGREVPLSAKAVKFYGEGFSLSAASISTLFRELTKRCGIEGLTFHDLRATAATRLSKRLDALQLAKMFGWRNVNQAMTYYRERAEDIAKKL